MAPTNPFSFQNQDQTYAGLPEPFFRFQTPTPVASPRLEIWNPGVAESLGVKLDEESRSFWEKVLSGNQLLEGARPLAMAYAGHQFGHLALLGDGRALLLGEVVLSSRQRLDLQLKGSGMTPFLGEVTGELR